MGEILELILYNWFKCQNQAAPNYHPYPIFFTSSGICSTWNSNFPWFECLLSRTNFSDPLRFEISRVYCTIIIQVKVPETLKLFPCTLGLRVYEALLYYLIHSHLVHTIYVPPIEYYKSVCLLQGKIQHVDISLIHKHKKNEI